METKKTLNDLKITISIEEYFSLSYYRHLSNIVVVSEERYNLLKCQEGFNELIYAESYISEKTGHTLYKIQRITDNIRVKDSKEKDKEKEIIEFQHGLAKQKNQVIDEWKKASLYKLMKTGKVNKEQAMDFISRAMNPKTERDKIFAEKLNYPYREDCIVVSEENQNKLDPSVRVSETSLTYGKKTIT